jgi:hypothetical protein
MILSIKAPIYILLAADASFAFTPPTKGRIGKLGERSVNTCRFVSNEEDGDWINSVNSKEIVFDEKSGRFFETPKESTAEEKTEETSGPFSGNPLKKPEGTFFDDLFSKKEEPKPPVSTSIATTASVPPKEVVAKSEGDNPFAFFGKIFNGKDTVAATMVEEPEPIYFDPVTIKNDFRVAGAFLAGGLLLDQIPYIQLTLGPLVTLLGLLFLVQSFRIRFVFNEKNELELVNVKNFLTGETESSGENVVVGGENAWACNTVVNYDFFPEIGSSPVGPILVYFKETQTPEQFWNDGPGEFANNESKINSGEAVPGQVHFFPAVCSSEQIREEFEKRGCGKL